MSSTVSVVIPTHNRPELLREAVESVCLQTCLPLEIIIVDDASSPPVNAADFNTPDGIPIRVVRHNQSLGGAAAKNAGAHAASGELLAFLDDDDLYAAGYLERALNLLSRHHEVDVTFMAVAWFGPYSSGGTQNYEQAMRRLLDHAEGREVEPEALVFGPALVDALLLTVPMGFQRIVVRASAFQRIGDYTEHCILWDCDWALRAALDGPTLLNQSALYRQRAAGQGFFSQAETTLKHLRSSIEIRERLGSGFQTEANFHPHLRKTFRHASAGAYFNLAYYLQAHGQNNAALHAWLESQKRNPSLRLCKFPLRILASTFRRLLPGRKPG
ncbi:glycosyltransferase family 2 protein [Thiobacillus sp.]|uniref:glycosyltransferase family 2 protein n=1 Tax=Thiobacillus sp. TaxID=924 RepID=UPI00286DB3F0|nr:glycosyltransferase [Thiobacillus sp.]